MTKLNKAINEMTVEEAVQETIEFARKYLNIEVQPHQEYWMESIIRNERETLLITPRHSGKSAAMKAGAVLDAASMAIAKDTADKTKKPRGKKGRFAKK